MIESIEIRRFKSLRSFSATLAPIDVFVGSNNCGKSSVLQAIHFAVSLAQSRHTLNIGSRDQFRFIGSQLIYSPARDIPSLASDGELGDSDANAIEINLRVAGDPEPNRLTEVSLRRDGGALLSSIRGNYGGQLLEDVSRPFSIYVPGLSGIASTEAHSSFGTIRRAVARGDANLILRNVLYRLVSEKRAAWGRFLEDLTTVFPNVQLEVTFQDQIDEFIHVKVDSGAGWLPLESAGTGFLQTVQILSYLHLFEPYVALLDEPDSHLHPNNQRALIRLLVSIVARGSTQMLLATHSRHILDSLGSDGARIWVRGGTNEPHTGSVDVLVDLGALDSAEGLLSRGVRFVILTEDAKKKGVQTLLDAIVDRGDLQLWSYKGCSNIETAAALAAFIREVSPQTRIVVHRDSDYLMDDDKARLRQRYLDFGIHTFFTPGVDIEATFCREAHLISLNPEHEQEVRQSLASALQGEDAALRTAARNGAKEVQKQRHRANLGTTGEAEIIEWASRLDLKQERWVHGKTLLAAVRSRFKEATKLNLSDIGVSEHVQLDSLREALGLNIDRHPVAAPGE